MVPQEKEALRTMKNACRSALCVRQRALEIYSRVPRR